MSTQTVVVQPEAVSNMPAWPGTDKTGGQKLEINLANGSDGPNGRKLGVYDDVVFDPSLKPKPYHIKGTPADSRILFQDVNILDSTGADPYRGDVFVEGERFKHVGVVPEDVKAAAGVQVIEGRGRTLMSGLGDAHTHLTWVDGDLEDVGKLPVEEHVLLTAASAKTYLDSGYTMCFGAASAKDRLDIVIRNAINEGRIPGPRCLANGREIARRGGELEPGITTYADGPLEMREVIRRNVADGVNLVKLSMSGEQLCDNRSAEDCYFTDEETAACVDEAHRNKVRVCAHARAKESVKMCVRHGVDVIYHASWTDEEGMDMLVQNKSRLVVAPAIGAVHAALYNAAHIGLTFEMAEKMGYKREFDQAVRVLKEMHRRGVTVLPGGDYGFAFNPHGTYARDIELFVTELEFTPMEAILSATAGMARLFMQEDELGRVLPGYYADCLLVDGDPLQDIAVLQNHDRLDVIMINGRLHKADAITQYGTWGTDLTQARRYEWDDK